MQFFPRIQLLGVLFRSGHPCRGFTGSSPCGRTKGRSSPRVNRGDNLWGPSCGSFTLPFIKNFELFPTREWAGEPRALAPVNRGENMWRLLCGFPSWRILILFYWEFCKINPDGGVYPWKSYDVTGCAVLFQNCFSCFLKWERQPCAATTFSTVSWAWWIHKENNRLRLGTGPTRTNYHPMEWQLALPSSLHSWVEEALFHVQHGLCPDAYSNLKLRIEFVKWLNIPTQIQSS